MRKTIVILGAALASLVVIGTAAAHIDTTPSTAPAGRTKVIGFTIGHGCGGSPTRSVTIRLPAGITSAKPRPNAGWTIKIKRGRLPHPVKDVSGKTVRHGVLEVTWSGTPNAQHETFELRLGLPNAPGRTLYFPMVQRCAKGLLRWIEIPRKGQAEPEAPAPAVKLVKPSAGRG